MAKITKDTNIKNYIKSGIQTTELLIQNKHFVKAYQAIQELLKMAPEDKKLIRLKDKIINSINKENESKAKKHMLSLEPLWAQKKYKELVESYKKLYKLVPHYKPLIDKLKKAQELYLKSKKKNIKGKLTEAITQVDQLINNNKFKEALKGAKELSQFDPTNPKIQKLLQKAEKKYADKTIEEIENEGNYTLDDKIKAYKVLASVVPNYTYVEEVITKTQKLKFEQQYEDSKRSIKDSIEKIKGHLQKNEFNKALKICEQIQKNNPSKELLKLQKKALKQKKKFVDKKLFEILEFSQKELQNEYNIDNKKFVKI